MNTLQAPPSHCKHLYKKLSGNIIQRRVMRLFKFSIVMKLNIRQPNRQFLVFKDQCSGIQIEYLRSDRVLGRMDKMICSPKNHVTSSSKTRMT